MSTPKQFGMKLARYLRSSASYKDVPIDGSWVAGGCWILAEGLKRWIGKSARVLVLVNGYARPQHMIVSSGDVFIDGSGVSSSLEKLVSKFEKREGVEIWRVYPLDDELIVSAKAGQIPCPARQVSLVKSVLEKRFGDPEQWGL